MLIMVSFAIQLYTMAYSAYTIEAVIKNVKQPGDVMKYLCFFL